MRAASFLWSVSSGKGGKHHPVGHALSLGLPGSLPRTSTYPCLQSSQTQSEGGCLLCLTTPHSHWSAMNQFPGGVIHCWATLNNAHTASQSLMLTPLDQKHRGLPSAQLVPGERQQLRHDSPLHPQPLARHTLPGAGTFMSHGRWALSVSRENS